MTPSEGDWSFGLGFELLKFNGTWSFQITFGSRIYSFRIKEAKP